MPDLRFRLPRRVARSTSPILLALMLVATPIYAQESRPTQAAESRTELFDEVWRELARHDAFFNPKSPATAALRKEYRARLEQTEDPVERLRIVVRAISRLADGHTHLTTRWLLPDKPPPPLHVAPPAVPLFRPQLDLFEFRKDHYLSIENPAERDAGAAPTIEECRVYAVDDALVSHGSGWSLLNGPEGTEVELTLERPNGERIARRFPRTIRVIPPQYFTTTTQAIVKDPQTGEEKAKTVEIVIEKRRLEGNLGYIRIAHLVTSQAVTDFDAALDEFMDTDGLILDLRDNRGGYPWIMLPITGRFYSTYQRVCSFDGRSPLISGLVKAVGKVGIAPVGKTYTKPVVVLINDETASMGEGLAFSLGDSGRAVLIGRPTMGLNAAIRNVTLSDGFVLWHSWIRVNRTDGRHYQNVGVEPHELVQLSTDEVLKLGVRKAATVERARQFDRALERLRELVASPTATSRP